MARDVVRVLMVLPKMRSKGKCAFESMETVFYLIAVALLVVIVQASLTLARSLGLGPKGGNCWTPYVYLPLADRAYISRCPAAEINNTFTVNEECAVDVGTCCRVLLFWTNLQIWE